LTVALPSWPLSRAADAVVALCRAAGISLPDQPEQVVLPAPPAALDPTAPESSAGSLAGYLDAVAAALHVDLEAVSTPLGELADFALTAAPAILLLRWPEVGLLLALRTRGRRLTVVAPDGSLPTVDVEAVVEVLAEPLRAPVRPKVERLLDAAGVKAGRRRQKACRSILEDRLSGLPIPGGFLLRLGPARPLRQQARSHELPRLLRRFAGVHFAQYGIGLLTVFLVGNGALRGRIDSGWLLGGALLLALLLPLQSLETWLLGRISIASGILLRSRLLWGALRLPLETSRRHGHGDFIGQAIESEVVELGLRNGGLVAVGAGLDLLCALGVLLWAAWGTALLLVLWGGVAFALGHRYYRERQRFTDIRFSLTDELLEKMLGHRTRLVQESRAVWHRGEDQALLGYAERSRSLDAWTVALWSGVPFGWLVLGILSLGPLWLSVAPQASQLTVGLALGLWGVLLGFRALVRLCFGLSSLAGAAVALRRCRHLLDSAAVTEPQPLLAATPSFCPPTAVLQARGLRVRYDGAAEPVLREVSLRVEAGQRVLIQGASGSGKSTLLAALSGLQPIESGQLLLGGLDLSALGAGRWRKLVATAPQFHENHLFSAPLAFNLLVGRAWPPRGADLREAERLCRELGLGPLIDRMPAGLNQFVGETGWRLSHGERSRVYIARTLLQRGAVVLLDESFAALDPQTLAHTLRCVLERSPTLVVVAHP
jgi:ATP-binding cassette subfamily B protein